jgi:hypothetical protein
MNSDQLWHHSQWRRYPGRIVREIAVTQVPSEFVNPFGGQVYLDIPAVRVAPPILLLLSLAL